MKYSYLLLILLLAAVAGCKKDKDDLNNSVGGAPVTNANGWSYHGKTKLLVNSRGDYYDLYLAKVHQHGSSYYDVFYGVRYLMPNYTGPGDGIFFSSTRWILKTDGTTQRHKNSGEEFTPQLTGMLYEPVYYTFSGGPHSGGTFPMDYTHPIDVDVYGTGPSEFKVYNPGAIFSDQYFTDKLISGGGNGFGLPYYLAAGSTSPASVISSPSAHLKAIDKTVVTQNYWGSFNMAVGTNTVTNQSLLLSVNIDSQMVIANAVAPQNTYSPDYGSVRQVQPMFGKRITEIIPQWNTAYQIEMLPYYYQYNNLLYVLFQNRQQLFVVTFNLNTFQFQVVRQYTQPRSVDGFGRITHHFQWIDTDEETFLFTEKRQTGVYALLHKNGSTQQIQLPQFKSSIAPAVMDIHYNDGKYWMIVAEDDYSLHLFSKNY